MLQVTLSPIDKPPELAGKFEKALVLPWNRKDLEHVILVPKGFVADSSLTEREIKTQESLPISRFKRDREFIEVSILGAVREVSLVDLVGYLREVRGWALRAADAIVFDGREAIDVLAEVRSGESVRAVIMRSASRYVEVCCRSPAPTGDDTARAFSVTLATFRFRKKGQTAFVEPFDYTMSTGVIPVGFRGARAWRTREVPEAPFGRQILDSRLHDRGDVIACLRVEAIDREVSPQASPQDLCHEALKSLQSMGFEAKRLDRRFKARLPGGEASDDERGEIHQGRAFGTDAEARIAVERRQRAHFLVTCVTPTYARDPWTFMIGKRAFEIAVLTLNRPEETLLIPKSVSKALAFQKPVRKIEPVYTTDGKLDPKTFESFGLDVAAAEEVEREYEARIGPRDKDPDASLEDERPSARSRGTDRDGRA